MDVLPKSLQGKSFTFQEARAKGVSQYLIRRLLSEGSIERIERGQYRSVDSDLSNEELYQAAQKRVGEPSAICLLSALSQYELTDIIPKQLWIMVPAEKRAKSSLVKLYRARDPKWKVGVTLRSGYSITSVERTIVDSLTLKKLIPLRTGIEALREGLRSKKTTASKVLDMASALGVKHRVLPYIEALT